MAAGEAVQPLAASSMRAMSLATLSFSACQSASEAYRSSIFQVCSTGTRLRSSRE